MTISLRTRRIATEWPATLENYRITLDEIASGVLDGGVVDGIERLFRLLESWRTNLAAEVWTDLSQRWIPEHPIMELVLGDPITRRSFDQPRGYAGDAELLDHIYGLADPAHYRDCSSRDLAISGVVASRGACDAVRDRRRRVANLVDRVVDRRDRPRILSVAAGHCREAELSTAAQSGRVGEWIAFDQDERSLAQVRRDYGHLGLETRVGSIGDILKGKATFSGLDCVYSAGLYDYLNERLAQRLTARLFEALGSGGTLLVANFLRGIPDAGFMEACMRWNLIFRDRREMLGLVEEIPVDDLDRVSVHGDDLGQLVYLEITKR